MHLPDPTAYICVTCGTQFAPSPAPPVGCAICLDERQYVRPGGQRWTTLEELAQTHHNRIEEAEPGLTAIATEPQFGIGQRALHVEGLLWDCLSLIDEDTINDIARRGGIETIAISHPHYYTTMVEWADRLDARVLLHEADREWIMRPSKRIELWSGEELRLSETLTLIKLGGHFAGGTVCLWSAGAEGRGALLSGDILQVVADRDWVSFMWSYPNLIPLPAREVARIRDQIGVYSFDRVYGAFWDRVIGEAAHSKVRRSADRYIRALG
jgi:hypothetical protein